MMTRRQQVCLAALAIQSLERHGTVWRCGVRGRFSNSTVQALLVRRLARRIGDRVIGILVANDNRGVGK